MGARQVRTLDRSALETESRRLLTMVRDAGFDPDAVVAIATGGVHVADAMALGPDVVRADHQLQRPGTATKSTSLVRRTLAALPYAFSDRLRLVEDRWAARTPPDPPTGPPSPQLVDLAAGLAARGCRRVLVVDDAVDSGRTLAVVVRALEGVLADRAEVRSAVLTVTRAPDRRVIDPDHRLMDRTLLRFPWSSDYRGPR